MSKMCECKCGVLKKICIILVIICLSWIVPGLIKFLDIHQSAFLAFHKERIHESPWNYTEERLKFGYHLPNISTLLSQHLIQKHNTLVSDIKQLYKDIQIIQTKSKECHNNTDRLCNGDCYGIGVSLILVIICIADKLRDGIPVIIEETCGTDHWPVWDQSKTCSMWFGCYLPKFEYKPLTKNLGGKCNVNTQWFADKYGDFMYYSSIWNYIYNGNIIKDNKKFEITNDDCIAVNIRRGDACYLEHRRCYNYTQYLDAAIVMRDLYDLNNIVLVTDAHDIDVGIELFQKNGFKVMYSDFNRTGFNSPILAEMHKEDYSNFTIKEYFDDINSGYKCKALIGTFTSSVSKIIFTLMLFNNQYYPPFYSLGGCAALSVYIDGATHNCPQGTNITSDILRFT